MPPAQNPFATEALVFPRARDARTGTTGEVLDTTLQRKDNSRILGPYNFGCMELSRPDESLGGFFPSWSRSNLRLHRAHPP